MEDCFFEVLRSQVDSAITEVKRSWEAEPSQKSGIYPAIASLCERTASDAVFAQVCFADTFAPRSRADLGRQYFIGTLADLVAPEGLELNAFDAEVFANVVWGVLRHYVASEQARQLPSTAATLVSLFHIPMRDGDVTMHVIQRECAEKTENIKLKNLTAFRSTAMLDSMGHLAPCKP